MPVVLLSEFPRRTVISAFVALQVSFEARACLVNALLIVLLLAGVVDSGNILQIVSAPGQQIIRPQGSMVMQTMPQAVPAPNASATPVTLQPPLSTPQQGDPSAAKMLSCRLILTLTVIYYHIFSLLLTLCFSF